MRAMGRKYTAVKNKGTEAEFSWGGILEDKSSKWLKMDGKTIRVGEWVELDNRTHPGGPASGDLRPGYRWVVKVTDFDVIGWPKIIGMVKNSSTIAEFNLRYSIVVGKRPELG